MGYTAQLNPQLLDVSLLVFIEVVLDRTTPEVFDAFKRSVQVIPEVLECHMVAGGFDYLIKARVKDMSAYREFLGKSLLQLKGVRETHTYAVMEEVQEYHEAAYQIIRQAACQGLFNQGLFNHSGTLHRIPRHCTQVLAQPLVRRIARIALVPQHIHVHVGQFEWQFLHDQAPVMPVDPIR